MGRVARHVVVGLAGIEFRADARFELLYPRVGRQATANGVAGCGHVFERRECIADHGGDVQRACRLIEGPEGLGAIGIAFVELVQLGMGQLP